MLRPTTLLVYERTLSYSYAYTNNDVLQRVSGNQSQTFQKHPPVEAELFS